MAVTMTPLQLAVAMAVAITVVAAAAALPPFCSAAAYARPAASALPDAKADASAYTEHGMPTHQSQLLHLSLLQLIREQYLLIGLMWYRMCPGFALQAAH